MRFFSTWTYEFSLWFIIHSVDFSTSVYWTCMITIPNWLPRLAAMASPSLLTEISDPRIVQFKQTISALVRPIGLKMSLTSLHTPELPIFYQNSFWASLVVFLVSLFLDCAISYQMSSTSILNPFNGVSFGAIYHILYVELFYPFVVVWLPHLLCCLL